MIRTYAVQTLLAVASAAVTVGLLTTAAEGRTPAAPAACPVADSLTAGALPFAVSPQPEASGTTPADA